MNSSVKISLILPLSAGQKCLARCLDSILAQTLQEFEVICVLEHRFIQSDQNLMRFMRQDKRIKSIVSKYKGLSGAKNTGWEVAKGEYLFYLNPTDSLPDYALDFLYRIAKTTQSPLVASRQTTDLFVPRRMPRLSYTVHSKMPFADFVNDLNIGLYAGNKLYHKKTFKSCRWMNGMIDADWVFLMECFEKISMYVSTEIPCVIHSSVVENPIINSNEDKINGYLIGIQYLYEKLKDSGLFLLAKKRMAFIFNRLIGEVYLMDNPSLKRRFYMKIRKLLSQKKVSVLDVSIASWVKLWKMKSIPCQTVRRKKGDLKNYEPKEKNDT